MGENFCTLKRAFTNSEWRTKCRSHPAALTYPARRKQGFPGEHFRTSEKKNAGRSASFTTHCCLLRWDFFLIHRFFVFLFPEKTILPSVLRVSNRNLIKNRPLEEWGFISVMIFGNFLNIYFLSRFFPFYCCWDWGATRYIGHPAYLRPFFPFTNRNVKNDNFAKRQDFIKRKPAWFFLFPSKVLFRSTLSGRVLARIYPIIQLEISGGGGLRMQSGSMKSRCGPQCDAFLE